MGCNMSCPESHSQTESILMEVETSPVLLSQIVDSDKAVEISAQLKEKNPNGRRDSVDSTASTMSGYDGSRRGSKVSALTECEYMGAYMESYADSQVAGVLSWLGYSPPAESPCGQALHMHFPGAIPGVALHMRTLKVMAEEHGCTPKNTIFGASCCPDEINWTKSGATNLMSEHWGRFFPLGGISGAPFSGTTGFGAFSAHVPDNGNVIVLFAPHVGISASGEIGKHLRNGQRNASTSCGAVIGAYNCCVNGKHQDKEFDPTDMQMDWIKRKIAPHAENIKLAGNPMAALAYHSYEIVKQKIMKVVNTKFGNGKLILIGGIMINMPEPHVDHFLPLHFEVRQEGKENIDCMMNFLLPALPPMSEKSSTSRESSDGGCGFQRQVTPQGPHGAAGADMGGAKLERASSNEFNLDQERNRAKETIAEQSVFSWLSWSPAVDSKIAETMRHHFPGALPGHAIHERVRYELEQSYALSPKNTILGLSICPDEINYGKHDLAAMMRGHWSNMFPLGGISGAPFAGKTGYGAFAAHVPENGNIIVFFGPHVGITQAGEIGQYLRDGQKKCSTSCGAVIGAYKACLNAAAPNADYDENDMQMNWIKKQLQPYACRICDEENPMAALAHQAYEMVKEKVMTVVSTNIHSGYVVLIGGIQINLPKPLEDHFMPIMFEVHTRGALVKDLMSSLKCPYA